MIWIVAVFALTFVAIKARALVDEPVAGRRQASAEILRARCLGNRPAIPRLRDLAGEIAIDNRAQGGILPSEFYRAATISSRGYRSKGDHATIEHSRDHL